MNSKVRNQVMASVLIVYTLRRVLSAYMLKIYALAIAALTLAFTVSLPNIIANLMHVGLGGAVTFIIAAIVSTTLMVQVLSVIAVCMGALLVRDSFRISPSAALN